MLPSVFGIGYPGDGPYPTGHNGRPTVIHQTWKNMLQRCYCPVDEGHKINYAGVTVAKEWFNFQNYAKWHHDQIDKFGEVDFTWHIDKDLLYPGNKIYSPDKCLMVPAQINTIFNRKKTVRGKYPLGIVKKANRYIVRHEDSPKNRIVIGSYSNLNEAQCAYWESKFQYIKTVASDFQEYIPLQIRDRFLNFGWVEAIQYYGLETVLGLDVQKETAE